MSARQIRSAPPIRYNSMFVELETLLMANVAKLLMIQGGKCFYCGQKLGLDHATIDHVVAKAHGGENTEANTVACCRSINQAFGNATPKEKLTAVSIEVSKLVAEFAVKKYGKTTFANLVKQFGYRIENNWCFPPP